MYVGSVVDQPADPVLYRRVVEAFPDAWIEDPKLTPETERGPGGRARPHHLGRDHPHRRRRQGAAVPAEDDQRQAVARRAACGRCSRSTGTASEHGIQRYGGGQFELGVGRGQIQYLASIFHPDTPERRGARRLQRRRAGGRPADEPAARRGAPHGLPLGIERGPAFACFGRVAWSARFGRLRCAGRGSGIEGERCGRAGARGPGPAPPRFCAAFGSLYDPNAAQNKRAGSPSPSLTATHAQRPQEANRAARHQRNATVSARTWHRLPVGLAQA